MRCGATNPASRSYWTFSLQSLWAGIRVHSAQWKILGDAMKIAGAAAKTQCSQIMCTGMTQRDEMGREMEGGSGWGTHINPWLNHVNVWQKPLQYCKVISLQLIKINGKKKDTHDIPSRSVIGTFQLTHKSSQILVPKCASSAELFGGLLKNTDSGASEHEI